jgi:hypothetical protein
MHQQLIMNIIDLFTPQSKVDFYSKIFDSLDLSDFPWTGGKSNFSGNLLGMYIPPYSFIQ